MTARTLVLRYVLVLAPLLAATPVQAVTDDAMEAQRCVWRCMYNTPGWDGRNAKAYNQCTIRNCGFQKGNQRRKRR